MAPIITKDQVRTFGRHVQRENANLSRRSVWIEVGVCVLRAFLGQSWIDSHLDVDPHPFFHDFRSKSFEVQDGPRRIYYIANALLNLQHVENFSSVISDLQKKHIEGGYAVLETARPFFSRRYPFKSA